MKKVFYIVLGILLMGAGACTERIRLDSPQEEGTVTIDMSVTIPGLATKAVMAEKPDIDNIYVAVYGSSHYLNDYVKAFPYDPETKQIVSTYTPINGVYNLRVTLQATASKRYIHILANGPDHLDFNTKEDELLNNINTSVEITTVDGKIVADGGAYWSYFELPNGTAVLNSDGNWEVAPTAFSAFTGIQLIRNFAKVKVLKSPSLPDSKFILEGFHVYRTAAKGSFAMPMQPTEEDADDIKWGEKYLPPSSYAGSAGQTDVVGYIQNTLKYPGHMPMAGGALAEADFIDTADPKTTDTFYNNEFQYVYESPYMGNDWFPYIIVKGKYNGSNTSTYYKIEFSDGENRIPLYRNVDYTITLTAVGKVGETDPKNAQTSNVNVSTMATELSEISDGISALSVEYTEKTFVIPAQKEGESDAKYIERRTKSFKYQYVKTLGTPPTYDQASFSDLTSEEGGDAIVASSWTKTQVEDQDNPNWYDISFLLNPSPASGSSDLVSTFVVTGTSESGGTLHRTIKVRVIPVPSMTLNAAQTTGSNAVTLTMALPDNLPGSIFPLFFNISDSAGCLNPNGQDMPVVIDDKTHTYHFVKTVTLSEYKSNHTITCALKRIKSGSTTISVSNEYFDKDGVPTTKELN